VPCWLSHYVVRARACPSSPAPGAARPQSRGTLEDRRYDGKPFVRSNQTGRFGCGAGNEDVASES
jgi:hypothetical protein